MALTSPDFRFLRVNRALCQITGYTPAAARGPAGRLDHPPRRPQGRLGGARGDARGRGLQPPRRAPLPARLGQRGVGGDQLDARARRRRQAAPLPLPDAGHHRAPPPRGRAAPHGRPRPADRAAQPPLVRARARAPRRLRRALRPEGRGDRARPRPLQDDQRHARPLGRRRADRARRPRAPQPPARVRRARPPRRRRVRDPAARGHAGGGRRASPPPCSTSVRTLAVPTATGRTRTVTASLGIALFDSAEQ